MLQAIRESRSLLPDILTFEQFLRAGRFDTSRW
jgi:hypothetical protein